MTKEELDKIKKHLLVGGEIGLPHYSHKTTVDKTVLDQLVRGVESLHQQLEAAHAFHDVAVKQRDAREWMLRDAERERDELKTRLAHAEADAEQAVHNEALTERQRIVAYIHACLAHATMDDRVSMRERGVMIDLGNAIERGKHEQ